MAAVVRRARHPSSLWLPWFGQTRPVVPWESRPSGLVFVGRVTPERPVRTWFLKWLEDVAGVRLHHDLPHAQMLDAL
jgi:hypothetical protein